MIDMTFVNVVESALHCAVSSVIEQSEPNGDGCALAPAHLRRLCKDAAQRLLFDLDGQTLLQLGMDKLTVERQEPAVRAGRDTPPTHGVARVA